LGELLDLNLAEDILLLFFKRGRIGAHVSEPLMPLGSHLHVRIVGFGVVLDDPPVSPGIQ
jgi:hypothetical protein